MFNLCFRHICVRNNNIYDKNSETQVGRPVIYLKKYVVDFNILPIVCFPLLVFMS